MGTMGNMGIYIMSGIDTQHCKNRLIGLKYPKILYGYYGYIF